MVRQGLKLLLQTDPVLTLIAEAGDGLEAVEVTERLKPDVLLLDLMLPRLHGLDVIARLRPQKKTKIVAVSMYSDEGILCEALENGVWGYVLKSAPGQELLDAIQAVLAGQHFVTSALEKVAKKHLMEMAIYGRESKKFGLTRRERVVLELAAQGRSNEGIANQLFISKRTVEKHRGNLLRKLRLRSQTDLVRYAIRKSIINP